MTCRDLGQRSRQQDTKRDAAGRAAQAEALRRRHWSRPMSTTFKAAVESYLRAKTLSGGTRNEYHSTVRKWEQWGADPPIAVLQPKEIREFLDWVHEPALAEQGTNPGRTANKAREHLRA